MNILSAQQQHIGEVQAIYAWHVEHGIASFETQPPDSTEMAARLAKVQSHGTPWLVAVEKGEVIGYCYLAPYRPRYAYRFTLEDSVYVHPSHCGKGVGRALLSMAIDKVEQAGYRQLIAVIGNSENHASLGLHQALGFAITGTLHAVGFKHGRWVDTVLMQRTLGAGDRALPETC